MISLKEKIFEILPQVEKPARYIGSEINSIHKDINKVDCSMALVFPDIYEIGMSYLGFKILYGIINNQENMLAERAFSPWKDMENLLREKNIPLTSLESFTPLKNFDVIAFTLQYELTYTNILNILDLSQIPLRAKERENYPLIIAGGPCAFNPEPLADFIDAFVIGDGEEVILELAECIIKWKKQDKKKLLLELAKIRGIYVPSLYQDFYTISGEFQKLEPLEKEAPLKIEQRLVLDLENAFYPTKPIVPFIKIIHDRISLEISRGCNRKCHFCQASVIHRPRRKRSLEKLIFYAQESIKNTGYEEISLLSLSSGDYPNIQKLIIDLNDCLNQNKVSLSFPSLNIESYDDSFAEQIKKIRKSNFTFAPEVATEKMAQIINKPLNKQKLFNIIENIFKNGWKQIKLYFMIGLPEEDEKDIEAIVDLIKEIKNIPKSKTIVVNISCFVPKTHTPFQRKSQNKIDLLKAKIRFLKKNLKIRNVQFKYHDPEISFLEAVFSRGDRKLGRVLYQAWENGCKFDQWTDEFCFEKWLEAFKQEQIDPEFYANREIDLKELLAWEHIVHNEK